MNIETLSLHPGARLAEPMPAKPPMFYYRFVLGRDGRSSLEQVPVHEFTQQVRDTLRSVVEECTRHEDAGVYPKIAAGEAAKLIFKTKTYRDLGLTKQGFCVTEFGRSPRTIDSYIAAADSYSDIGGIECPVQPDSVHQLDVLKTIVPDRRRQVWLAAAESNGGHAPSGVLLTEHAVAAKAVIQRGKNKKKVAPEISTYSCATLSEAISLAEAQYEFHKSELTSRDAVAWAKIRQFLGSFQNVSARGPRVTIPKAKKPKQVRDIKGQALMFEEQFVLKNA